jgi:hypothetical protein
MADDLKLWHYVTLITLLSLFKYTRKISSGLFSLQWQMIKIVDRVPGWFE